MSDLPLFDWGRKANRSTTPRAPARHIPGSVPLAELPDEVRKVFALLRDRCGKERAIKAADIADALGIFQDTPKRERRGDRVRHLINRHKLDAPFLILATSANGFYRSSGPEDMTHFERSMYSRIREIYNNVKAARYQARREGYSRSGKHTWALSEQNLHTQGPSIGGRQTDNGGCHDDVSECSSFGGVVFGRELGMDKLLVAGGEACGVGPDRQPGVGGDGKM